MEYDKIFKATTKDGKTFIGGNLKFPAWNKCPEKMTLLAIRLPYGDHLVLSKYESYNFFIGAMKNLKDKKTSVNHIYALGKRGDKVTSYRITLVGFEGNKYKIGDITARIFPFGKEGIGRTATSGWKEGCIE